MESIKADFGDGERTVYFGKHMLGEMDRVDKVKKVDQHGHITNPTEVVVETLMARARTEQGAPMFSASDRARIMREFDADEVVRVVGAFRAFDIGEQAGN